MFYNIVKADTSNVHKFYKDASTLSVAFRASVDGSSSASYAIGPQRISSRWLEVKEHMDELKPMQIISQPGPSMYTHPTPDDDSNSHQPSQHASIMVSVLGLACSNGSTTSTSFMQSFLLAPQSNGYYVQNDVLRFIPDNLKQLHDQYLQQQPQQQQHHNQQQQQPPPPQQPSSPAAAPGVVPAQHSQQPQQVPQPQPHLQPQHTLASFPQQQHQRVGSPHEYFTYYMPQHQTMPVPPHAQRQQHQNYQQHIAFSQADGYPQQMPTVQQQAAVVQMQPQAPQPGVQQPQQHKQQHPSASQKAEQHPQNTTPNGTPVGSSQQTSQAQYADQQSAEASQHDSTTAVAAEATSPSNMTSASAPQRQKMALPIVPRGEGSSANADDDRGTNSADLPVTTQTPEEQGKQQQVQHEEQHEKEEEHAPTAQPESVRAHGAVGVGNTHSVAYTSATTQSRTQPTKHEDIRAARSEQQQSSSRSATESQQSLAQQTYASKLQQPGSPTVPSAVQHSAGTKRQTGATVSSGDKNVALSNGAPASVEFEATSTADEQSEMQTASAQSSKQGGSVEPTSVQVARQTRRQPATSQPAQQATVQQQQSQPQQHKSRIAGGQSKFKKDLMPDTSGDYYLNSIFVRSVPEDVKKSELQQVFRQYGALLDDHWEGVQTCARKQNTADPYFAFVNFKDKESATRVLNSKIVVRDDIELEVHQRQENSASERSSVPKATSSGGKVPSKLARKDSGKKSQGRNGSGATANATVPLRDSEQRESADPATTAVSSDAGESAPSTTGATIPSVSSSVSSSAPQAEGTAEEAVASPSQRQQLRRQQQGVASADNNASAFSSKRKGGGSGSSVASGSAGSLAQKWQPVSTQSADSEAGNSGAAGSGFGSGNRGKLQGSRKGGRGRGNQQSLTPQQQQQRQAQAAGEKSGAS